MLIQSITSAGLTLFVLGVSLALFLVIMQNFTTVSMLSHLSLLGPIISFLSFISPLPSIQAALETGSAAELPFPIIACQLALCIVNAGYGSAIKNGPIVVTNILGIILQALWIVCWYYLRWKLGRNRIAHPLYFSLLGMTTIIMSVAAMANIDADVVGTLSVVINIMFTFSPMADLGQVVRTRKTSSIPPAIIAMMFLGNVCWGLYGWIIKNNVILLPNLLGFEMSVFLVIVYLWCHDKYPYELYFLTKLFPVNEEEVEPITRSRSLDFRQAE
jgi:uncharacterized protein with PQ loop repeat